MGCSNSVPQNGKESAAPGNAPNFGKDPNLNPADFMCKNQQQSGFTLVKAPGDIRGQQFLIEDCSGADIFLLDHIGSMTIDNCTDCRIVTGPVSSSIFMRDCRNCTLIVACQQLRLRDCRNINILLFSITGPIIESSCDISLGCYSYNYFGLVDNFKAAQMSCWNNFWYDVYDFTPEKGNVEFLPPYVTHATLVPSAKNLIADGLAPVAGEKSHLPLIYGVSYISDDRPSCLVIVGAALEEAFREVHNALPPSVQLIRSTQRDITMQQLEVLLESKAAAKSFIKTSSWKHQPYDTLVCQYVSADITPLTSALSGDGRLKGQYLVWDDNKVALEKGVLIFETWKQQS